MAVLLSDESIETLLLSSFRCPVFLAFLELLGKVEAGATAADTTSAGAELNKPGYNQQCKHAA